MDQKLDRVLAWMSERTYWRASRRSARRRCAESRAPPGHRAGDAGRSVSGIVSLLVSMIAAKFHWTAP